MSAVNKLATTFSYIWSGPLFVLVYFVFYYDSTPHYAYDCIYYSTAAGRKFLHYCDVVHKFSDDVIMQRREELLQVYNISVIGGQFKSVLLCRKHNQLESTRTF